MTHPSYIEWAKQEVAKETGDPDWRLLQLVSWAHRMSDQTEVVPTTSQEMMPVKITYATKEEDHVTSLERQVAEMRAEIAELKSANDMGKSRQKQSVGPMSVSDGSYEEVHP